MPLEAMKRLIQERQNLIIKIGDSYEISRPLALELWKLFVSEVIKHGGSIKETVKVEYASSEMVIVSMACTIKIGESEITLCEVGEASIKEKGKEDTLARTAFTRAMKRLLERLSWEDFINQVIQSLFPDSSEIKEVPTKRTAGRPATERQKHTIIELI